MTKEQLLEKLYKDIGGEDKLEQRFGYLAPLIVRYVAGVAEICPNVSEQFITNLVNTKIAVRDGSERNFNVGGLVNVHPSHNSLDDYGFRTLKLFTNKKDHNINLEETTLPEYVPELSDDELHESLEVLKDNENRFKLEWQYGKTAIHELNHACAYTSNILVKEDKTCVRHGKVAKTDLNNGTIWLRRGGYCISKCTFDENGNFKRMYGINTPKMVHEGITEYLAHKIYNSTPFDDFMLNNKEKGKINGNVSYAPMYFYVGATEGLYDKLLSKLYFSPLLTQEQLKTEKKIIERIKPVIDYMQNISKIDRENENYKEQLAEAGKRLASKINHCANDMRNEMLQNWETYDKNSKVIFMNNYNKFLEAKTWKGFVYTQCKLKDEYELDSIYKSLCEELSTNRFSVEAVDEGLKTLNDQDKFIQ